MKYSGLFCLLMVLGCSVGQDKTETLWVAPERADCVGAAPMKCLQVKKSEDGEWELFYNTIEGFDYEEGYNYKISVSVEEVPDPPADGSGLKYTLIEVIKKTLVDMETAKPPVRSDLYTGTWQLRSYSTGEKTVTLETDKNITIQFDEEEQRVYGTSVCNNYNGKLSVDAATISIGPLASTRKMCIDEGIMEIEQEYYSLLESVERISPDRSRFLTLMNADGGRLQYLPVEENEQEEE